MHIHQSTRSKAASTRDITTLNYNVVRRTSHTTSRNTPSHSPHQQARRQDKVRGRDRGRAIDRVQDSYRVPRAFQPGADRARRLYHAAILRAVHFPIEVMSFLSRFQPYQPYQPSSAVCNDGPSPPQLLAPPAALPESCLRRRMFFQTVYERHRVSNNGSIRPFSDAKSHLVLPQDTGSAHFLVLNRTERMATMPTQRRHDSGDKLCTVHLKLASAAAAVSLRLAQHHVLVSPEAPHYSGFPPSLARSRFCGNGASNLVTAYHQDWASQPTARAVNAHLSNWRVMVVISHLV